MAAFNIRQAKEDDCEDIMQMVKALAAYVIMADSVKITVEDLRENGFGENPLFYVFVAESTSEGSEEGRRPLVGYVLYYYSFNPYVGRCCYVEDFYVKEDWRKQGIGSALWATVAQRAVSRGCAELNWTVLRWNQASIDFYKRRGAQDMTSTASGYLFFKMEKDTMNTFIARILPHAQKNTA